MATITTTELATELDTTPRTLRKFLRADAKAQGNATPGKGSRYAIERKAVKGLQSRFAKWTAAQVEAKAMRDAQVESETETD